MGKINSPKALSESLCANRQIGGLVDRRIILKCGVKEYGVRMCTGSGMRSAASCCKPSELSQNARNLLTRQQTNRFWIKDIFRGDFISHTRRSDNSPWKKNKLHIYIYTCCVCVCVCVFGVQARSYVLAYLSQLRHLTSNTELSQLPHLTMNLSRRHNSNVTRSILGRITREDL